MVLKFYNSVKDAIATFIQRPKQNQEAQEKLLKAIQNKSTPQQSKNLTQIIT